MRYCDSLSSYLDKEFKTIYGYSFKIWSSLHKNWIYDKANNLREIEEYILQLHGQFKKNQL